MLELVLMVTGMCQLAGHLNESAVQVHCRFKQVRLTFAEENVTPMQCMMGGQVEAAKWVEFHPDWQIEKITCARAGMMAKA